MRLWIGESFVGEGANAAHVNVLAGPRDGPVGHAFAQALASPRPGHLPFLVVLRPGVPCKPATVFVNKAELRGEAHERLTWGPAQMGVALGVQEAQQDGVLPAEAADDWVVIASVWVDWAADDADRVFAHNRRATREALERALANRPTVEEAKAAMADPANPFYAPPER